jgi:hypothetical protein
VVLLSLQGNNKRDKERQEVKAGRKPRDQKDEKGEWKPTPEQKRCVDMLLIGTERAVIVQELKITEQTYYNWLRDEKYLLYINKRRNMNFAGVMPSIDNSLIKKALANDKNSVSAIRTLYERVGEINGEATKQPITIVFNARAEGLVNRPYTAIAKEITSGS